MGLVLCCVLKRQVCQAQQLLEATSVLRINAMHTTVHMHALRNTCTRRLCSWFWHLDL
jgi:hypothetical protein